MTLPDHNRECWTAFCPSEDVAELELRKMVAKLAEKKLIVTAKKELRKPQSYSSWSASV